MVDEIQPQAGESGSGAGTPAGTQASFDAGYVGELRRENAKHRTENNQLAAQLAAMQEQLGGITQLQKTLQTLADKQASIEKALADAQAAQKTAELKAIRAQVAARYGIPEALAARLQGESPEQIEADAAELAKALPTPTRGGYLILSPGNGGTTPPENLAKKMFERGRGKDMRFFDPTLHKDKDGGTVT